ncbi:hypothetical protein [Patiriisocius sp. Uisw_017]|jgi:hypothetical protein|uniref:hypothetical protein n=1 Tax=Patiriisocius sp. Uisw_017 TaxID=3230968 RepID=UPI0039EB1699
MKSSKFLLVTIFLISSFIFQAQEIDPDTGQVIDVETKELNEDAPLSDEDLNRNKVLDRVVKVKSRHKPWRIRTSFNNKEFGDLDISKLPINSSFLVAIDIPTFTLYKDLYIGIGLFGSVNRKEDTSVDVSTAVVYGANLNLNYSFEIIEGLYVVPLIGYGYLGISESEFINPEIEPEFDANGNIIVDQDGVLVIEDTTGTALNYGVFLDFSFNLRPKGIGITAGYTNYSKFTFGIQYGL